MPGKWHCAGILLHRFIPDGTGCIFGKGLVDLLYFHPACDRLGYRLAERVHPAPLLLFRYGSIGLYALPPVLDFLYAFH
ncbi:hypothetical protein SDC9_140562 [bioreactor metagenome]|uniref:Uncharacterized protein n=1 Tax=bioreactor metagenome TaxID=1076179 RepID=A0A645DVV0_9ZZZZ